MASIRKYEMKNGDKRYMFRMYLGIDQQTGKKRFTTRRGFKTQKEAKIEISRLQLHLNSDEDEKDTNITFEQVFREFYKLYALSVRSVTLRRFEDNVSISALPSIGNKRIRTITLKQLQSIINDLSQKYERYKSRANNIGMVFDYAFRNGYIKSNPYLRLTFPKGKPKEKKPENFYNREELQTFLSAPYLQQSKHQNAYTYFRLLAFSGMRRGEALALKWSDIDFNKKEISVTKTMSLNERNYPIVGPTKSDAGNRVVPMDETTMNILKSWQISQRTALLVLGLNANSNDPFVFSKDGTHMYRTRTARYWQQEAYKTVPDLKRITIHGFRHTHASMLFAAGISVKEVQVRLGHANPQITLGIYTHVTKDQKTKAVEKLSKFANF